MKYFWSGVLYLWLRSHLLISLSRRCNVAVGVAVICSLIISIGLAVGLAIGLNGYKDPNKPCVTSPLPPKPSVVRPYRFGAVATDAERCSRIGADILALRNGSAVDAAIAALICVGAVNIHHAGIGGGSFAVVYSRSKRKAQAFDFRETAPGKATEKMFEKDPKASLLGPLAIAVPSDVAGFQAMHDAYGRLPWADLFQPTIDMMEEGVVIGAALALAIQRTLKNFPNEKNGLIPLLVNETTGKMYEKGDRLFLPKLTWTLKRLAAGGAQSFYHGELADDIAADLRDVGSIITKADIAGYKVIKKQPLTQKLDDLEFITHPPPSGGVVVQFLLNILQGFKLSAKSVATKAGEILTTHRIVEAMKFAFAKRSQLGDPKFINVQKLVDNMTSPMYGERVRRLITDDRTHDTNYYGASFQMKDDHGTTHLSVIDREGNAVAITSTINTWFGSKVVGKRTGIVFNNCMDDFSTPGTKNHFGIPASPTNFIVPGKRAMSSMSPTIVVDKTGDVRLVSGGAGGTRIITSTSLFIIRSLYLGRTTQEAMDNPRFHHQLVPTTLGVETNFPEDIAEGLREKGHELKPYERIKSAVEIVVRIGRFLYGVSDMRRYSVADGY